MAPTPTGAAWPKAGAATAGRRQLLAHRSLCVGGYFGAVMCHRINRTHPEAYTVRCRLQTYVGMLTNLDRTAALDGIRALTILWKALRPTLTEPLRCGVQLACGAEGYGLQGDWA